MSRSSDRSSFSPGDLFSQRSAMLPDTLDAHAQEGQQSPPNVSLLGTYFSPQRSFSSDNINCADIVKDSSVDSNCVDIFKYCFRPRAVVVSNLRSPSPPHATRPYPSSSALICGSFHLRGDPPPQTDPVSWLSEDPFLPISPAAPPPFSLEPISSGHILRWDSRHNVSQHSLSIQDWDNKLVVNLSSVVLDPLVFNFLKGGLNFAFSPRSIPHVQFILEIENMVQSLPIDIAEEVRQDCAVVLRHAKPPKSNIPKS
ncbi:hypothetical protein SUGI_0371540 [Cryptomeria japonica]|nr:hypothetical protein SUGI_0371540 [Cryptomeria japonica]